MTVRGTLRAIALSVAALLATSTIAVAAPSDHVRSLQMTAHAESSGRCDSPSGTCGDQDDDVIPGGWLSDNASANSSWATTCCAGWTQPMSLSASADISGTGTITMNPAGRLQTFIASGGGSSRATMTNGPSSTMYGPTAGAHYSVSVDFDLRYASTYDLEATGSNIVLHRNSNGQWSVVGYRTNNGVSNPSGTIPPGTYRTQITAGLSSRMNTNGTDTDSLSFNAGIGIDVDLGLVNVNFDYRRPARYGLDEDGDGKVNGFQPDGFKNPVPQGYPTEMFVDPCDGSFDRRWYIDGTYVAEGCSFTYDFPAEGSYLVTHRAIDPETGATVADRSEPVVVDDILIVSIGDSVASGEGAPEIDAPVSGWQNNQCHRSAAAGPAKAAARLEEADPRTSVTFVHLACSGATIDEGLLGSYRGVVPGIPLPPQVDQMLTYTQGRTIDALLISIGANDIGFSTIVELCMAHNSCGDGSIGSAEWYAAPRLATVGASYDRLAAALTARGVAPSRVYLTEYFDPMRDHNGAFCDETILEDMVQIPLFSVTAAEAQWASESLLPRLNAAGAAAAARHGWNRPAGTHASFRTHGYCAATGRWITQLSGSFATQGDYYGALHPNRDGHAGGYAPMIAAALPSSSPR